MVFANGPFQAEKAILLTEVNEQKKDDGDDQNHLKMQNTTDTCIIRCDVRSVATLFCFSTFIIS